jgi:hypothetical protein
MWAESTRSALLLVSRLSAEVQVRDGSEAGGASRGIRWSRHARHWATYALLNQFLVGLPRSLARPVPSAR